SRSLVKGRPMSDHDAAPDPMDKAYAQAEAILHDESARAARRARVLAAVAREPAPPPAVSSPAIRRPAWGRGGWLVAASVAGASVLLATQVHLPAPNQRPPQPPRPLRLRPRRHQRPRSPRRRRSRLPGLLPSLRGP